MLAGISTVCFGASYGVALVLELSRLMFRSGCARTAHFVCGRWTACGYNFLGYRAATATSTPLSSAFDWYLVAAWVLAAVYLYLTFYHARTAVGLFILPLVLASVGVANLLPAMSLSRKAAPRKSGAYPRCLHPAGDRGRDGGVCGRCDVSAAKLSIEAQTAPAAGLSTAEPGMTGPRQKPAASASLMWARPARGARRTARRNRRSPAGSTQRRGA